MVVEKLVMCSPLMTPLEIALPAPLEIEIGKVNVLAADDAAGDRGWVCYHVNFLEPAAPGRTTPRRPACRHARASLRERRVKNTVLRIRIDTNIRAIHSGHV